MRKQFKLMADTDNRTFFKDGLNRHQYYTDDEGDMHCIETFLNVYTNQLNEQHSKINELEERIARLEQKEQNKEKNKLMWALNQFRYKEKTEEEQEAFLILERAFKKTPLR